MNATGADQEQNRGEGVVIDLERLETHARNIYLTRFVEAVKAARGNHGRYLVLRSGDEIALRAAEDGSFELLNEIRLDEPPPEST
jgi:hypothetical protein